MGLFHGLGFSRTGKGLEVDWPGAYHFFLHFVKISGPAGRQAGIREVTWKPKLNSTLLVVTLGDGKVIKAMVEQN